MICALVFAAKLLGFYFQISLIEHSAVVKRATGTSRRKLYNTGAPLPVA